LQLGQNGNRIDGKKPAKKLGLKNLAFFVCFERIIRGMKQFNQLCTPEEFATLPRDRQLVVLSNEGYFEAMNASKDALTQAQKTILDSIKHLIVNSHNSPAWTETVTNFPGMQAREGELSEDYYAVLRGLILGIMGSAKTQE